MWKTNKRLLSLFVSVCMVLSMLPVTARAAEVTLTVEGGNEIVAGTTSIKIKVESSSEEKFKEDLSSDAFEIVPGETGASLTDFTVSGGGGDTATIEWTSPITKTGTITITVDESKAFNEGVTLSNNQVSITVKAASANKLAVTGPSTTSLPAGGGKLDVITVTVQDEYGNTCTNDTTEITAEIGTGDNCSLAGQKKVTAIGGVAEFNDLTLNYTGSEDISDATIKFSGASLQEVSTAALTILAKKSTINKVTASGTLTVDKDGGEITLTADGGNFASTPGNENFTIKTDSDVASELKVQNVTSSGDNTATLTITGTPTKAGSVTITIEPQAFSPEATNSQTAEVTINKAQLSTVVKSISITKDSGTDGAPVVGDKLTASIAESVGKVTWSWEGRGEPKDNESYTVVEDDVGSTLTVTVTADGANEKYQGSVISGPTATVTRPGGTMNTSPLTLYAGTGIPDTGEKVTLTLDGTVKFRDGLDPANDFSVSCDGDANGLSITAAQKTGDTTATLTLSGTPEKAGEVTITANTTAFKVAPSDAIEATGSITVQEAPSGDVTANVEGELTAGVDASSVQIKLTPNGLTFASDMSSHKNDFTIKGCGDKLTVTSVTNPAVDDKSVTLILSGIPDAAGAITVEIGKDAFYPLPQDEAITAKGSITVAAPSGTLEATLEGGTLYEGTKVNGQMIKLTINGSKGLKFKESPDKSLFTLSGGLTVEDATSADGTVTLTLSGTPSTSGNVTITVKAGAFEIEPSGDQTASINVEAAPKITATANKITAGEDTTITVTATGNFATTPDASLFGITDTGNIAAGVTVSSVQTEGETATLTLSGKPTKAGTLDITIQTGAFNPVAAAPVTATVTVNAPTITMTATPNPVTEGDGIDAFTLTAEGGVFADVPNKENFSVSIGETQITVSDVKAAEVNNKVTVTLESAPNHDGTMTITVQPAAFKYQPSAPVKAEVTVNAPEPTLEATTTLVAGTAGGTITITESSDADADNFRSGATSDQFTITTGDYKESLTVSEVKVDETSVTLTITGIPTKAGQLNIEVAPEAFEYEPKEKVTANVTVGYPTVEMTVAPTTITEGKETELTLTLTSGEFAANPTGSITVTGIDGVSVTSVTAVAGEKEATLTLSQAATHTGTMTITAKPAAFKYQPKDDVTAKVTVRSPDVSLKGTTTLTVGREGGTITLTEEGDAFKDTAAKGDFTLSPADIADGLTVESVELNETKSTATLTITGTPKKSGELTVTVKKEAFSLDLVADVTATVTVSPAPSAPSTTVDKPDTDTTTGETTVDVNTNSTLSGTTANASVSGTNMDKAVNSAVDAAETAGTSPVVEVNVNTSSRADGINVTLPANSLDKLAQAEGSSLVIVSDVAEVALDNTALTALAEQADTTAILSVTPAKDMNEAQTEAAGTAPVVDVTVTSGGKVITDYHGGVLLITLPYTLPAGHDASSVVVFYLDDAGKLTACATSYKDSKVTFLTKHLSKYVIGSTDMNEVTLTAASTLAAGVSGGTITLTATGAAFAEAAAAASFTLSDTNLTVSAVQVSGATATLTVTGTPAAGTLTVTAKKEAFDPAAAADATATVTVAEAAPAPTTVTLTATSTLAVDVNGGTITLATDGAAFAETADKANFTLSDTALTVTAVKVDGKTATLTVTGTPAESETLTVTVGKEAITGAEADVSVRLNVTLFTFDFTFETSMVDGRLVLNVGIEVFLRRNLLVTIPVVIPIG